MPMVKRNVPPCRAAVRLAERSVEPAAMLFQPAIGPLDVTFVDLAKHRVKCRTVIEMNQMRHFMCDN